MTHRRSASLLMLAVGAAMVGGLAALALRAPQLSSASEATRLLEGAGLPLEAARTADENLQASTDAPSPEAREPSPVASVHPGAPLSVTMGSVAGAYSSGASVVLLDEETGTCLASTTVDEQGRFSLETPQIDRAGRIHYFDRESYETWAPPIVTRPGTQPATIHAKRYRSIALHLLDDAGLPYRGIQSMRAFAYPAHPVESFAGVDLHPGPPVPATDGVVHLVGLREAIVSVILWTSDGRYGEAKGMSTAVDGSASPAVVRLAAPGRLRVHCLDLDEGLQVAVVDARYGVTSPYSAIASMVRSGARARLVPPRRRNTTVDGLCPLDYRLCVFGQHDNLLLEQPVRIYSGGTADVTVSLDGEAGWLAVASRTRGPRSTLMLIDRDTGAIDRIEVDIDVAPRRLRVRRGRYVVLARDLRVETEVRRGCTTQLDLTH